jgi:hypothetical protein
MEAYEETLVCETKLQMVTELPGHIFDITAQIINYGTMLHRASNSL